MQTKAERLAEVVEEQRRAGHRVAEQTAKQLRAAVDDLKKDSTGLTASVEEVARAAVKDIGYEQDGFHWKDADVQVYLHQQSADIAQGVDAAGNKDEGAGDQGIMFGYACDETPELMPAAIMYAHQLGRELTRIRKEELA